MIKERQNFVYGNEEEGIPGCINNGIDEKTANQIWDEMLDFANMHLTNLMRQHMQ